MIKNVPTDLAEAYKVFFEEAKSITSVTDLDYLFIKLKGTGAEELLKEIEEDEAEEEKQEQEVAA